MLVIVLDITLRALYIGSTSKVSLEQRHNLISTTFQRCSNVRCPLGILHLRQLNHIHVCYFDILSKANFQNVSTHIISFNYITTIIHKGNRQFLMLSQCVRNEQ